MQVGDLLAHIIVRCKKLRESGLCISKHDKDITLAKLAHRKLRYSAMLGNKTLAARLDKLSMHPPHTTDGFILVVSDLKYLKIHSSDQPPKLLVPTTLDGAFQSLHTFSASGYGASKPLQALLQPAELSQLEADPLKKLLLDLFDYSALTKSLDER